MLTKANAIDATSTSSVMRPPHNERLRCELDLCNNRSLSDRLRGGMGGGHKGYDHASERFSKICRKQTFGSNRLRWPICSMLSSVTNTSQRIRGLEDNAEPSRRHRGRRARFAAAFARARRTDPAAAGYPFALPGVLANGRSWGMSRAAALPLKKASGGRLRRAQRSAHLTVDFQSRRVPPRLPSIKGGVRDLSSFAEVVDRQTGLCS